MAREIKTTLAVDGEQAYKRAINDAKQSVRNLGTQLSLAQAEFKKSGDAQKLMETRAKTLKNEIDQQNEIVKSLDNALKDAVKQYGEGSKEAEKWEAELNRAKATMASLEAELANNERGLDRNGRAFDSASTAASDFNDAVHNVGRGVSFELITTGIGKITSGFESAIKKASELALSMWNMMRDAASWADDEITLAKIYGVDVEELQQMQHAAKIVDTDIDTIIKARQKLMQAMGKELNSEDITAAFQALRTPVYDENGKMREMETVFWQAGSALMALDDEVQQNNIAMQLFGKSWMELRPLFEAGSATYKKAMEEATVVPQENIEKLGALQDQLDRLDTQFQTLKMNVLSELAPAFETLASALTSLMAEFNEYLQTDEGKAMMESLNEAIQAFFSELRNVDMQAAVSKIGDGLDLVKDGFLWIKNNKDTIIDALKGIGLAFAGLKLAEIAANLGKVTWGFKQLFGGTGKGTPTAPTTQPTTAPTGGTGGGFWVGVGNTLTNAAAKTNAFVVQNGLNTLGTVVGDLWLNQTNAGRAVRDGGDFFEGLKQDFDEKKDEITKNASTFEEDWKNNELRKMFVNLGINNIRFWDTIWKGQKEAEEWNLGDHVTAEEAMNFVNNGGEMKVEPEKVIIEPDDNWTFGDDASIEDIMNWMNSREGAKLTPNGLDAGVSTGLYAGASAAQYGEALTSQDLAEFTKVPDAMKAAVAAGVSGIKVNMDGRAVGSLVAPIVSVMIANDILGVG